MSVHASGDQLASSQAEDSRSATDRTIDEIVSLIGAGEFAPLTRLPPESQLAAMMGVSRGPLREAIRVLDFLGIVDVRVGDGTYVTQLDGTSLLRGFGLLGEVANERTALEIFEIRRVLESAAAAMAASRITEEQLCELEEHLAMLGAETDSEKFVMLDMRFHDLIASATGNAALRMLCASFSARTQRARLLRGRNVKGILARSSTEHEDIFRHIKNREPVLAAAAVASHIANVEHWLRQEFEATDEAAEQVLPTTDSGAVEPS